MTINDLNPKVKKALPEIQRMINELKRRPAFSNYVKEHNLKLISNEYKLIDDLLDHNILN
jgi:hypothetical protein